VAAAPHRVGFEARLIDRFMCSRHAEGIGAAIAASTIVTVLLFFSAIDFNLNQILLVFRTRGFLLGFFGTIFAVGGWWTVRTWRQLWRCGRSPWERLVFDTGVRGAGCMNAICVIAILGWLGWKEDSGAPFGPLMIGGAVTGLFFGAPVCLHLGYFFGRSFASVTGIDRDSRLEIGDPPHPTSAEYHLT
jgi:hypothetical protein